MAVASPTGSVDIDQRLPLARLESPMSEATELVQRLYAAMAANDARAIAESIGPDAEVTPRRASDARRPSDERTGALAPSEAWRCRVRRAVEPRAPPQVRQLRR
jgi:ketosteroid isomerase-like protein